MLSSTAKLIKLRNFMRERLIDAFIVYSADAHKSEYVADSDKRRAYLCHFTGSAGTAVVTQQDALLWTDGRYFNQASIELPSTWTLMKSGECGVPEIQTWLSSTLSSGQAVALDSRLVSAKEAIDLQKFLSKSNIDVKGLPLDQQNPIDLIWSEEEVGSPNARPTPPTPPARVHPLQYAGVSHVDKLRDVQSILAQRKADMLIVSALDEIAWLFNLRGSDVSFNPVVTAYAVVCRDELLDSEAGGEEEGEKMLHHNIFLFIDENKLSPGVTTHLLESDATEGDNQKQKIKISLRPYHELHSFLSQYLASAAGALGSKQQRPAVLLDSASLNWSLYSLVDKAGVDIQDVPSVIATMKTIKNPVEIQGIRNSHIRDGVALTAFLNWLNNFMMESPRPLSEHEAAEVLETYRAKMPRYVSPSFDTISSYGSNGAVIHYHPPTENSATLGHDSLYLLDSGGQYLDGTTDVTRTLYFGRTFSDEDNTALAVKFREMRDAFTYVLRAHIALATAKFPEDTLGYRLDAITRAPLWAAGLDFAHGTGHGVGAFLNVHEGPQGIGMRPRYGDMGFKAGMTTSNEPGYYKDGDYGIRIENVCVTVDVEKTSLKMPSNKKFLGFDTVTLCPLDRKLINTNLLSNEDIHWVNEYHGRVRMTLHYLMSEYYPEAIPYLMQQTEPL